MRWDTGGGCLGIIILTLAVMYAMIYVTDCIARGCP